MLVETFPRGASYFSHGGAVECGGCGRYVNPVVVRFGEVHPEEAQVACPCCGAEGRVFDSSVLEVCP
jgi:NAD-dependent SIR2 family protein deacetylase